MKKYILLFLFMAVASYCEAQVYNGSISSLMRVSNKYHQTNIPDKLYLQLNKTNYGPDDTLWFKAYLLDVHLQQSTQSNIIYVEISNESNVMYIRRMVITVNGLATGCFPLPARNFPEGGYTLRAYTNWMRNFDEKMIFKKQFYISNVNRDKWMMNFSTAVQKNDAQFNLQIVKTDKQPVADQSVLIGARQGDAVLRRDKPHITSPRGELGLEMSIRNNGQPVYVSLHKGSYEDIYETQYKFPIIYNRPEKIDVQFMPEGGYLVAGLKSMVGVKVIGENGKGINLSGSIVNSSDEEVATFTTVSKGMGSFAFTPQADMVYKAVATLPNGIKKEYPFPKVKSAGTVLTVINSEQGDSVAVKLAASPGISGHYVLTGQSRGLICFIARVTFPGNTKILKAPKSAFASGIVRFTLLDEKLATLNERVVYIDHHDNLQITVTPHKDSYTPQDSIALQLMVKDKNGEPVQGHFSMSVINDVPLNPGKENPALMETSLLLTADLKGNVEDPAWYFNGNRQKELDNLLLTQGWTGFDWKGLFKPEKKPEFFAENGIFISGKVLNLFDKGVKDATVTLLSLRPYYTTITKTDEKGNFILKNIPQIDSTLFLKARNARGNHSTYEIDLDKPEWPVFTNELQLPWYVNTDTTALKLADTLLHREEQDELSKNGGKLLEEVKIKAKKIVRGSHNLNGPGSADQTINEEDIAKVGKVTLLQMLEKMVINFHYIHSIRGDTYSINSTPVSFIWDGGVYVDNPRPLIEVLNYFTSENILGIEVISGDISAYINKFARPIDPRTLDSKIATFSPIYIEITTRREKGANIPAKLPADIAYRPVPLISNPEFYRPAYPVKNSAVAANDQRTTIHWEPNIITDKDGKATVTFYAAGQPATYTITTEGSNMNGNVGSSMQKLVVKTGSP